MVQLGNTLPVIGNLAPNFYFERMKNIDVDGATLFDDIKNQFGTNTGERDANKLTGNIGSRATAPNPKVFGVFGILAIHFFHHLYQETSQQSLEAYKKKMVEKKSTKKQNNVASGTNLWKSLYLERESSSLLYEPDKYLEYSRKFAMHYTALPYYSDHFAPEPVTITYIHNIYTCTH